MIQVNITAGDRSVILMSYSPFSYIKKALDVENEKLVKLSKAMYIYGIEAKTYFN